MILNGECGAFNPMLLDCLQEISANLRHALPRLAVERSMKKRAQRLSTELLQNSNMPRSDRAQRELDSLREKMIFFASCCGGVQFEYDTISQSVLVVDWSRPGRQSRMIIDVHDPDNMRPLRPADVARIRSALKATTPENNELSISVLLPVAGEQHWHSIRMHTLWSPLSPGRLCRRDRLHDRHAEGAEQPCAFPLHGQEHGEQAVDRRGYAAPRHSL